MKFHSILIWLCMAVAANGQQIKVMSYNLRVDFGGDGPNNWEFRRAFLAEQIRYNDADFIGTQEGKLHQIDYLDSMLVNHSRIGRGRDDSANQGEFSAIFYNHDKFRLVSQNTFWLSETPDKVSKGWDAALERICTYGLFEDRKTGRSFYVFNTHFDHVGELARQNSALLILDRIKKINASGLPVLVTGDFNSEPDSLPYKAMVSGMKDARNVSQTKPFGPDGTFNGFKFCEPVKTLIDYIFVTEPVHVLKFAVLSDSRDCRYPSDHLPVLATVEF